LELSVHNTENTAILRVIGFISEVEVYRFSHAIRELTQQDYPYIAVDLSKVEYMESHALGILVSHFLSLQKQKRELVLINLNTDPSFYITRLLNSTRLNEMFRIINPSSKT